MDFSHYTTKAAEAVQAAQQLAFNMKHAAIDEDHLLLAMLEQSDGFVPRVLKQIDEQIPDFLKNYLQEHLQKKPKIEGDYQVALSQALNKDFLEANNQMKKM